jgi:hypothetical protein
VAARLPLVQAELLAFFESARTGVFLSDVRNQRPVAVVAARASRNPLHLWVQERLVLVLAMES